MSIIINLILIMNKKILMGVIIAVVIVGLGVGAYFWVKSQPVINVDAVNVKDLPETSQKILDKVKAELKQNLNNVDDLMTLAQYQKMSQDYPGAIKTLQYALTVDKTRLVAKNNLAEVYYLNNQFNEAEAMCQEMIADDIVWINSYNFLRDIYKYHMPAKYADDTLPNLLKEAIKQASMPEDKKSLYIALFDYYRDVNNKAGAISAAQEELKLDPKNEALKQALAELQK